MDDRVCIVGAGIGGLTLAIALAQRGRAALVLEQVPVLAEVGAGITLSPNSWRVLAALGLEAALRDVAVVPGTQHIQAWDTGATLRTLDRGPAMETRYGAPYAHIHRADLHALLMAAARAAGVQVRLGALVSAVGADGAVTLSDGEALGSFALVVGADGVKSAVRGLFGGDAPQFTGQVAWRGVVPRHALPARTRDAPPGIHVGPDRLFMRYPMRGGALVNYAAFVKLDWRREGWTIRSSPAELLTHFGGWHHIVTDLIEATPAEESFKWALHAREPLPTWVNGRATLLGDAAHAMLPFMGQGAATAIEDAMVLARALAAFAQPQALARYEAARRERTAMVQVQSRLLGMRFQGKDPAALGRGRLRNEEEMGLYDYDAVEVSI